MSFLGKAKALEMGGLELLKKATTPLRNARSAYLRAWGDWKKSPKYARAQQDALKYGIVDRVDK